MLATFALNHLMSIGNTEYLLKSLSKSNHLNLTCKSSVPFKITPNSICKPNVNMCKSSQDFSDYIICFLAVCVLHYVDIVVFPAVNYPSLPAAETWLFDGPLTHTCNRYIVTDGI